MPTAFSSRCPLQAQVAQLVPQWAATPAHCSPSCFLVVVVLQLELNEYADMTWQQFSTEKLGFQGAQALQRYATLYMPLQLCQCL